METKVNGALNKMYKGIAKKLRKRISAFVVRSVVFVYKYRCASCSTLLPPTFEMDHKVPLWHPRWRTLVEDRGMAHARDIANHMDNLQPLCPNCHAQKSMKERELHDRMRSVIRAHARETRCPSCQRVHSKYFRIPRRCLL